MFDQCYLTEDLWVKCIKKGEDYIKRYIFLYEINGFLSSDDGFALSSPSSFLLLNTSLLYVDLLNPV